MFEITVKNRDDLADLDKLVGALVMFLEALRRELIRLEAEERAPRPAGRVVSLDQHRAVSTTR